MPSFVEVVRYHVLGESSVTSWSPAHESATPFRGLVPALWETVAAEEPASAHRPCVVHAL